MKKRNYFLLLAYLTVLGFTSCKGGQQEFIDEQLESRYELTDCDLFMTSDGEGNLDYHFVSNRFTDTSCAYQDTEDYWEEIKNFSALTDSTVVYNYQQYYYPVQEDSLLLPYRNIPCFVDSDLPAFLPDFRVSYFRLRDLENICSYFPEKYQKQSNFSLDELEEVEEILQKQGVILPEKTFDLKDIRILEANQEFFFLDTEHYVRRFIENSNPETQDGYRSVIYAYNIAHPENGLKFSMDDSSLSISVTSIHQEYDARHAELSYEDFRRVANPEAFFEKETGLTRADFLKAEEKLTEAFHEQVPVKKMKK